MSVAIRGGTLKHRVLPSGHSWLTQVCLDPPLCIVCISFRLFSCLIESVTESFNSKESSFNQAYKSPMMLPLQTKNNSVSCDREMQSSGSSLKGRSLLWREMSDSIGPI